MATIKGSSKNDRLNGTGFDDVINGYEGDDELNGYDGRDELNGGDGFDDLFGGEGADVLNGGQGYDTLDGGAGADTMAGGTESDTYYVDNIGDVVIEAKNEGVDTVHVTFSYTLPSNVEFLVLEETRAAINGTGNGTHNWITGNSRANTLSGEGGDDILKGGGGADVLIGGSGNDELQPGNWDMAVDQMSGGYGNDVYHMTETADQVTENVNQGIDLVIAYFDYTLGANVENLTLQGPARNGIGNTLDNEIRGTWDDDRLEGREGNDTLYSLEWAGTGSGGSDWMQGGLGDDTYYPTGLDDDVFEWDGEGTDRIVADTSYTLPIFVENLSFTAIFDYYPDRSVNGTGNSLDNTIDGTAGINVLTGMGGDDRLYGHGGIDVLVGNEGNDDLDGGAGADVMLGGTGHDHYVVEDAGDVVTESPNEGSDFVYSWITYTLGANLERLYLLGDADIDGTGNDLDNHIEGNDGINILTGGAGDDVLEAEGDNDTVYGGEGNDAIDGGLGADTMAGGLGDDLYFLIDTGNTIVENANEGTDTVWTQVTHTLASNVENLTLYQSSGAINGTGNSLVNTITGNDDANVLSGMAGDDTLIGGGGIDQLLGGAGNDRLEGGLGDDIMDGGISNDTFIGGAGVDLLTGGTGVDRFQFNLPGEGADIVADFVAGTDRVWLDDVGFGLAGTGTLAANGVAFVLGSAATSAGATVMFDAATHQLLWDADGTGAGSAQPLATLIGVTAMSANDFQIV